MRLDQHSVDAIHVTPLMYALYSGCREAALVLLAAGCHVSLSDYLWCETNASEMLQNPAANHSGGGSSNGGANNGSPSILNHGDAATASAAVALNQGPMPSQARNTSFPINARMLVSRVRSARGLQRSNTDTTAATNQNAATATSGLVGATRDDSSNTQSLPQDTHRALQRSNTEPSNSQSHDVIEYEYASSSSGGGGSELQRALSAAASQPPSLFRQALGNVRSLLGQPYWRQVRLLLAWPQLDALVPSYRLRQWLLASHVTGDLDVMVL